MNQVLTIIFGIPIALAQTASQTTTKHSSQLVILLNSILSAIPYWFTGILVIIFSFIFARIAKSSVENKMTKEGLEEEHREVQIVVGRTTSAIVLTVGITAGLKIAGLDLTPIIAAAAFGIGFAAKDIIINFFAGIIILLQKSFTIGDWVKVNKTEGIIQEIQSRYTVIKKFNGTIVIVPNAELFKNQVTSFTANPTRRYTFSIKIDFYTDLKEVIQTIYGSINKCHSILQNPKPNILVTPPGEFYNNIKIRVWVMSRGGVLRPISALMRQIHKDFYSKGWAWPYPTQTLVFDKDSSANIHQRTQNYIDTHKKKEKITITPQLPPIKVTIDKELKVVNSNTNTENQPAPINAVVPQIPSAVLSTNPTPQQNINPTLEQNINPTLEQNLNPPL